MTFLRDETFLLVSGEWCWEQGRGRGLRHPVGSTGHLQGGTGVVLQGTEVICQLDIIISIHVVL